MKTELDLNAVYISENVRNSWLKNIKSAVILLKQDYPDLQTSEIPDEKFGINEDGAEIFVIVRNTKIRMQVPEGEYRILN